MFFKYVGLMSLMATLFLFEVSCAPSEFDVSQGSEFSDLGQENVDGEDADADNDLNGGVDTNGDGVIDADDLPSNQSFPLANGGLNSNGLPQNISGLQSLILVPTAQGGMMVRWAQPSIVYNNLNYQVVPNQSYVSGTQFVTVYQSPQLGQTIYLQGTVGSQYITCRVSRSLPTGQMVLINTAPIFYQW